ncbi:MAG: hypothetical protein RLY86_3065 [Pseudomonadota bacterium]|jgi:rhamnosyltransferase
MSDAHLSSRDDPSPGRIGAVIVTYHPDGSFADRVAAIAAQVDTVVIVDNTDGPLSPVLSGVDQAPSLRLVRLGTNQGIARALNIGLDLLASQGATDAVTLDQDSEARPGLVTRMLAVRRSAEAALGRTVLVAPSFGPADSTGGEEGWREVDSAITSGMLVPLAVGQALGAAPMDEGFFIDYVDFDFCLRARDAGYGIVQTRAVLLTHAIGRASSHRLLGRSFAPTNHAPIRRYYRYRNLVHMARRHGGRHRAWLGRELGAICREVAKIILFEQNRSATLRAILAGLTDGVRGRLGPRGPN